MYDFVSRRRPSSGFHWIPVLLAWALGAMPLSASAAANDSWWDGFAAPPVGKGMNSWVSALAVHDGKLVVGGAFTQAGNQTCGRHVARFNGNGWQALGCGTDGSVRALLSVGSDLYVGGAFTAASGVPAANVARWDGSWHAVGAGFGAHLCGLATYGSDVIAVGAFLESDGSPGNLVARWDGAAWQPLGDGLAGGVAAAAVEYDGELWVGGTFTNAGGTAVTGLARWNGTSWDDGGAVIAAGTNGWVNRVEALSTAWNGDLIVGGGLAQVNGVAVNGLASFDGTTWTPLGLGLDSEAGVQGIASYHGDLVVFGYLYASDGSARIARWNGVEWIGFGSGCHDHYLFGGPGPIAVYDDEVYVGGDISEAGQKDSEYIARWSDPAPTGVAIGVGDGAAVSLAAPRPNPVRASTTIEYALERTMTIDLTVYDAAGRVVATLANGSETAGAHQVSWDSRNREGDLVAAGLYFVRLTSDVGSVSRKFVVKR